jgi:hypothetical protein
MPTDSGAAVGKPCAQSDAAKHEAGMMNAAIAMRFDLMVRAPAVKAD